MCRSQRIKVGNKNSENEKRIESNEIQQYGACVKFHTWNNSTESSQFTCMSYIVENVSFQCFISLLHIIASCWYKLNQILYDYCSSISYCFTLSHISVVCVCVFFPRCCYTTQTIIIIGIEVITSTHYESVTFDGHNFMPLLKTSGKEKSNVIVSFRRK